MADFGKLLRMFREAAGVSMGALARYLEISVTYLSDVERGTRAPLTSERVAKAGEFLKLTREQVRQLDEEAGETRGYYELGITTPASKEVGATLMRGWPQFGDAEFDKIMKLLSELEGK